MYFKNVCRTCKLIIWLCNELQTEIKNVPSFSDLKGLPCIARLFPDQEINYKFQMKCLPIKNILWYNNIGFDAPKMLASRKQRFSKLFSFLSDQIAEESL